MYEGGLCVGCGKGKHGGSTMHQTGSCCFQKPHCEGKPKGNIGELLRVEEMMCLQGWNQLHKNDQRWSDFSVKWNGAMLFCHIVANEKQVSCTNVEEEKKIHQYMWPTTSK